MEMIVQSSTEVSLESKQLIFPLTISASYKNNNLVYPEDKTWLCPFRIFITNADGDFTNFEYLTLDSVTDNEPRTSIQVNSPNTQNGNKEWKNLFSSISTSTEQTTVNVGDTITVEVQSSDANLDIVYLEPICGIVDRTRVNLTNGIGTFNILTSSLKTGDIIDVKINHRSYTGVGRFTKTLS
jgi:hypothetical protein